MHSGELARLAGVTVRALRHYHQVGVLAETERSANGYRHYDVHDLVRVLRIKRLAAVGIPLERMPPLLDDRADDTDRQLDELDAELAAQIDRLAGQREVIARLREHRSAPDVPPELAPYLGVFAASVSTEMARFDRDQSVLLAHLAGEDGVAHVAGLYARLSHPDIAPAMGELAGRFDRLGEASDDREVDALVDDFVAAFSPVLEAFAAANSAVDVGAAAGFFDEYAADRLTAAQRSVIQRLETRLGGPGEEPGAGMD